MFINISARTFHARSELGSAFYVSILRPNGLKSIIKNSKCAIRLIIEAVKPRSLQTRTTSDLQFAQSALKRDFTGFLKHCLESVLAFNRICNEPPSTGINVTSNKKSNNDQPDVNRSPGQNQQSQQKENQVDPPLSAHLKFVRQKDSNIVS